MRRIHVAHAVQAALLVFTLGVCTAQAKPLFAPSAVQDLKRSTPEQRQERLFLRQAAAQSRFTAEASRLALERSTDAAVRQIAAAMINHYKQSEPELTHLLNSRGMAWPILANSHTKVISELGRNKGPKFDRIYMEHVALRATATDVEQYERIAGVSKDPTLLAWVERQLPTHRYHLQLAERGAPAGLRLATTPSPPPRRDSAFYTPASTRTMGAGALTQ